MSANIRSLRYVEPGADAGYTRRTRRGGFAYFDAHGRRVEELAELERIRALAVPPAWRSVWISADRRAHVQATGVDARGRKQYRYHPVWTAARSAEKFARLGAFCRVLPAIRRRVQRDLRSPEVTRDAAVAVVVALIERGHLRVGNEVYTRDNGSYGVTTLERRHVRVRGRRIHLAFRGKSGVQRSVWLDDASLARGLRRCLALPGARVFKFRDPSGRVRRVRAEHVNEYLHRAGGAVASAKSYRAWAASLCALARLAALPPPESEGAGRRALAAVIREVAARLGHTPAVCRESYVHPAVIDAYLRGVLTAYAAAAVHKPGWRFGGAWLRRAEAAFMQLVEGDA